ncbi:ead/Ea22-like family protein [Citrobacter farmeri]|uniref:ead/Ea22-like family protein n=1 Tax=Citrobacter farmeri TaxID=67824 RepID=UPI00292FEAC4|nr:ead/Ea22-like family protein [Citrobacter farmeri]
MSSIDKQALREVAEKFRATYAAHRQNPRNYEALDAWDKATNEFQQLVNNDELNIIASLLDELEVATDACNGWQRKYAEADERLRAVESRFAPITVERLISEKEELQKRVTELEARTLSQAANDVLAERSRQVTAEGWTPEHDDEHCNGELAMAAVCYINETGTVNRNGGKPWGWPWDASWWKPNTRRRNLVKATALLLAEIERIDRAAGIGKGE